MGHAQESAPSQPTADPCRTAIMRATGHLCPRLSRPVSQALAAGQNGWEAGEASPLGITQREEAGPGAPGGAVRARAREPLACVLYQPSLRSLRFIDEGH